MKIKNIVCLFFQMLIRLRVGAVIFELHKVSMSNFVKFKFRSMTLNIEGVFEKNKQYFESKTGQKSHEFSK